MMPPITPTLVYGSTTFQTTSHVVAPMPYADSFSTGGTISNTSRITEAMNGMTMIDRMMPADSMPMPLGAPGTAARGSTGRRRPGVSDRLDVVAEQRREHEQAPHAVDDRRNRREQLDRGAERPLAATAGHISVRNSAMPKLTGTPISERDRRGDQRAVDRRQRAEVARDRIPDVGDEERRGRISANAGTAAHASATEDRRPASAARAARRTCVVRSNSQSCQRPARRGAGGRRRARAARVERRRHAGQRRGGGGCRVDMIPLGKMAQRPRRTRPSGGGRPDCARSRGGRASVPERPCRRRP